MITDSKKVLALAALIVGTGVATVELTRDTAQAAEPLVMTYGQAYAAARVDTTFDMVMAMPATEFMLPMAQKGDLEVPAGCMGIQGDAQAECMDVAYEVPSEPSIVVETRAGSTSTLMRMDAITVAGVSTDALQQSE